MKFYPLQNRYSYFIKMDMLHILVDEPFEQYICSAFYMVQMNISCDYDVNNYPFCLGIFILHKVLESLMYQNFMGHPNKMDNYSYETDMFYVIQPYKKLYIYVLQMVFQPKYATHPFLWCMSICSVMDKIWSFFRIFIWILYPFRTNGHTSILKLIWTFWLKQHSKDIYVQLFVWLKYINHINIISIIIHFVWMIDKVSIR